jgi:hypothetical protein
MLLKSLFTLLIAVSFSTIARADQLQILNFEQADAAVAYLSEEEYVIIYCGCCETDEMAIVYISSVYYEKVGEDEYVVHVAGVDAEGNELDTEIDLAYVHVNIEDTFYCLGQMLLYECDPCTEPFTLES